MTLSLRGTFDHASPRRGRGLARRPLFFQEHERCGELDSAVDGDRVWMACGAVINGCADDE